MDGGLMVQKILPAEIITQNAAFAVVMFLGTGAMRISTTAPTAGRRWMEVTEVRLIDANRLYDAAEEKYMEDRSKTDNVITRAMLSNARQRIQMLIAYAPSVDAIPVVRCKDCKYGSYDSKPNGAMVCLKTNDGFCRQETDFCSYGERREGGNDNVSD